MAANSIRPLKLMSRRYFCVFNAPQTPAGCHMIYIECVVTRYRLRARCTLWQRADGLFKNWFCFRWPRNHEDSICCFYFLAPLSRNFISVLVNEVCGTPVRAVSLANTSANEIVMSATASISNGSPGSPAVRNNEPHAVNEWHALNWERKNAYPLPKYVHYNAD